MNNRDNDKGHFRGTWKKLLARYKIDSNLNSNLEQPTTGIEELAKGNYGGLGGTLADLSDIEPEGLERQAQSILPVVNSARRRGEFTADYFPQEGFLGEPIDIYVMSPNGDRQRLNSVLCASKFSRAKSLYIEGDMTEINRVTESLGHAAPNLQSLTITLIPNPDQTHQPDSESSDNFQIQHNFLGGHAPSLQRLELHNVSPRRVFAFPLPNLTHITWIAQDSYVRMEELLDLLEFSPRLEVITIKVRFNRGSWQRLKPVTLNDLRELTWTDHGGSVSLIPYLAAPNLNKLIIGVTHTHESKGTTLSTILSFDGANIPLLRAEPTTGLYYYRHLDRAWYFNFPQDGYLCASLHKQAVEKEPDTDIIDWSPSNFSLSSMQKLIVCADPIYPPPLCDIPIEKFEGLECLELHGENSESLIPLIKPKIDGILPIALPGLREVRIVPKPKFDTVFKRLMDVMKEWKKAGRQMETIRFYGKPLQEDIDLDLKQLEGVVDEVFTL